MTADELVEELSAYCEALICSTTDDWKFDLRKKIYSLLDKHLSGNKPSFILGEGIVLIKIIFKQKLRK